MKNKKTLICSVAFVLLLSACASTGEPSSSITESSTAPLISSENTSTPEENNIPENTSTDGELEMIQVMDSAKYKGTITEISDNIWTLEQIENENFGANSMKFTLTENTKLNTEGYKVGDYVEIFYGKTDEMPEAVDAIAINLLPAPEVMPEEVAPEKLVVMDAAMYRGEITDITDNVWTLTQVEGRDFGVSSIKFTLTENTRYNTEGYEVGDYVEVYYSYMNERPEISDAIAVNMLPDAEDSIINGAFVSATDTALTLKNEQGEEVVIATDEFETSFYLYIDELTEGEMLNVVYENTDDNMFALEVSKFTTA